MATRGRWFFKWIRLCFNSIIFQQKPKDRRLMRSSRGRASFSAPGALEKRDVSYWSTQIYIWQFWIKIDVWKCHYFWYYIHSLCLVALLPLLDWFAIFSFQANLKLMPSKSNTNKVELISLSHFFLLLLSFLTKKSNYQWNRHFSGASFRILTYGFHYSIQGLP